MNYIKYFPALLLMACIHSGQTFAEEAAPAGETVGEAQVAVAEGEKTESEKIATDAADSAGEGESAAGEGGEDSVAAGGDVELAAEEQEELSPETGDDGLPVLAGSPGGIEQMLLEAQDKSWYHRFKLKLANRILTSRFSRNMNFDTLDLRFRPHYIGIFMDDYYMTEQEAFIGLPGYGSRHFVESPELGIRINPYLFIFGKIAVKDVTLESPYIQFALDRERGFNLRDVFEGLSKKGFGTISVNKLAVNDATVRFYDATAIEGPVDLYLNDVDVLVENFSPNRRASLEVQAASPGANAQNVSIDGVMDVDLDDGLDRIPVKLQVAMVNAPMDPLFNYVPRALPLYPKSGTTTVKAQVTGNLRDGLRAEGKIDIKDLVLLRLDQETELEPLDLKVDLGTKSIAKMFEDRYTFKDVAINIRDSKITASGAVWDTRSDLSWDLQGRADEVKIDDLMMLNPLPVNFLPAELEVSGLLNAYFLSKGNFEHATLTGNMNFKDIGFSYGSLFSKKRGELVSYVFSADVYPEKGNFSMTGDFYLENGNVMWASLTGEVVRGLEKKYRINLSSLEKQVDAGHSQISKISGKVNFSSSLRTYGENRANEFVLLVKSMEFKNIHSEKTSGHDSWAEGHINLFTKRMDLKGEFVFSEELTKKLLPSLRGRKLQVVKGRLTVPYHMTGHIDNPTIKVL